MGTIFAFSLGLLYGNFVEWFVHRYLFHGLGKNYKSVFAFHLREHHIKSRKDNFFDPAVTKRENLGIIGLLLLHLPIYFFVSPVFYMALATYGITFLVIHKFIHTFPRFAYKYFWWHWNHHMHNQNKSWGVVSPLIDVILGTLEKRSSGS